jgi:DNA polymerase (family X)
LQDVRGDLQSHSSWSDGINSVQEMAEAARELGYRYLALTDHAEKLKIAGGMTRDEISARRRAIDAVNQRLSDFTLLNGIELNIDSEGGVDYEPPVLREFDITLASIHSGFGQPREKIMRRLRRAMENENIHIIAHPTGRIIGKRNPYDVDIEALLDGAAATGTILEINAFPDRLDLKDDYAREAKKRGVRLSLGTDAHRREHLSYMMYGVAVARRAWLEARDIINTYPLEKMLKMLK